MGTIDAFHNEFIHIQSRGIFPKEKETCIDNVYQILTGIKTESKVV
jgi:hypothetical protein